ncbi:MAG: hypothetical protein HY892_10065 [Deltaproteobacteria bacterium]|nr:hypothetical protein [Deltaproteobacteria bacterium]
MRNIQNWFLSLGMGLIFLTAGCGGDTKGPRELLDKFFASAVQQDYATTYTCYYEAYKAKVAQDEFIRHRKEASLLLSYKIISIKLLTGDTAEAEVQLTFGPSAKMNRKAPVMVTVKEELVKEGKEWKIKVW